MKLKVKIIKKFISILCAMSISTSFVITSASAIDTTDAEAAFSMQYINSLPKSGEENFDKFSGVYERGEAKIDDKNYVDTLQNSREYNVQYPDDKTKYHMEQNKVGEEKKVYDSYHIDKETINEKDVYKQIIKQVNELKEKVEKRTPEKNTNIDLIQLGIKNNTISKHYEMPYQMRLAKAIYRWVAKEIPYDHDSLAYGKGPKERQISLRKPQDPLYVFAKKTGVCAGKTNLLNLMMRLAGIPSVVTVSRTHAFNVVFLTDDKNTNRQGWVLLDSTWGAPKSDMSLQTDVKANNYVANMKNEKIGRMIKGTADMSYSFMKNNFFMDDEYAEKIDKMIYIDYNSRKKMNDVEITEFNAKLKEKLKELNASVANENAFKLTEIKIIRKENGEFLVEYETNVTQDKAKEFYNNFQEKFITNKATDMLKTYVMQLATDDFKGLNKDVAEEFIKINKSYNRDKLKLNSSKEYYNEFEKSCTDLLNKYGEDLENNINLMRQLKENKHSTTYQESETTLKKIVDAINQTIKSKIGELNEKYKNQDIVQIKSLDVNVDNYFFNIGNVAYPIKANIMFDLSLEDAKRIAEKQYNWSNMKEFFLGFYDKALSFKYANENIIDWRAHKIEEMVFGNWHDSHEKEKNSVFDRKIDGITYKMSGPEGNKILQITGNKQKNVEISPAMIKLGVPLKIGEGIKSLILKGDTIVDLAEAENLERIYINNSNKYMVENGVLYEKNNNGSRGSEVKVPKKIEVIDKTYEEKIKNEYQKIKKEYAYRMIEIVKWKKSKNIKNEGDEIKSKSTQLNSWLNHLNQKFDIDKAEEFIKLAKETIDMMDKFKFNHTFKEFDKKNIQFIKWKKSKKVANNDDTTKYIKDIRKKTYGLASALRKQFDINKAEEFIESAKETMDMMDKFMKEYNDNMA